MAKARTKPATKGALRLRSKRNDEAKTASTKKVAAKSALRPKKAGPTNNLLTSDQRRKLLKPRDGFDELVERISRTWQTVRALRVPGLTVARLLKLLRDAKRAADREQTAREKLERTLRPLYDGRLLAEHELWRAVLDVNAAVKLFARNDPALAETFGFLTDALTSNPGARAGAEPEQAEAKEQSQPKVEGD